MALNLTRGDLTPFLPSLDSTQATRVEAWIPVLTLLLDLRYGEHISETNRILFVSAAADSLERRLGKPAGLIDQETAGPFSTRYNPRAALSKWFFPEELDQLDEACGLGGGIRSVRMPVPDSVRFQNMSRDRDDDQVILP